MSAELIPGVSYDAALFYLQIFSIACLGLVFGSFATALSHRVPRGETWAEFKGKKSRSSCPSCGALLGVRDLVPVFSWLFLRGRCRHCGVRIGTRYPLIELVTLVACLSAFALMGMSVKLAIVLFLVPFLVALSVIDFEKMILPNQLVLITGCLGVLFIVVSALQDQNAMTLLWHGLAAIVYGGIAWGLEKIMSALKKREALGMGDIKFMAVAGLWLGLEQLPLFFLLSGFAGVMIGFVWMVVKKNNLFPFGPALILSFYTILILNG